MRLVVDQGVAVAHHAGGGVEPSDGQGAAQRCGDRLREAGGHAVGDHGDAAHGQGGNAVQRGDGERAALGQGRRVRRAAVAEVFLVDGEFTTVHVETADGHRIVVVVDVQHQVGGAGVAVRVSDRVGEGFGAVAPAVQGLEVGIAGVEGVGVGAVGVQHQRAVSPDESPCGDRPGAFPDLNPVGALHVVGQDVAGQREVGFRGGRRVAVIHAFRQVVDDVDVQRAVGGGAVVVHHGDGELLGQVVGAVGGRVRLVVDQGVAVTHDTGRRVEARDGQRAAQRCGDRLREAGGHAVGDHGDAAHGQGGNAVQRGDGEGSALGQRCRVRCAAVAEVFLVDGQLTAVHVQAADGHRIVVVVDVQHQVGGAGVAVRVGDGVGERFRAVAPAVQGFEVGITGVEGVGVRAVGVQHQRSVSPDESPCGDRPGAFPDRNPVGSLHVVGQDVAGQREVGFRGGRRVAVIHAFRQVVDDVHVQRAVGGGAVVVHHGDGELLRQVVRAVGVGMRLVVDQGVAVAHDAGRGVEASDGQGAAQRCGDRLREAGGHAVGDHGNAAHGQGGDAVQSGDGERAALGERRRIRRAAKGQVLLEHRHFAPFDVQSADDDGIVIVVDLQHQVRRAGVAIGVPQGVGEGLGAAAAAVQVLEVGVAGVERVGVGAVGVEHQGAVGADERAAHHRPAVGADGDAVGALNIVGQHIAGQGEGGFRGGRGIAVVHGLGHVVGDVDVQRAGRGVAVAVPGHHGEVFAEAVGTVARCMGLAAVEGVAVGHGARRRVVADDGQGVAQRRGDRLRETCGHATDDHVDAADAQAGQAVGSGDREAAGLGQRPRIGGGAVRQVGFVDGQFAPRHVEAAEGDGIVDRRHDRRRGVVAVVDHGVVALFGKLGNAAEPGGGETDDRIDPPAHFGQQHETVAAAQLAGRTAGRTRAGRGGFSGFRRIFAGGDGFLDLLDVGQLRFTGGQRFRGVDMGGLMGQ